MKITTVTGPFIPTPPGPAGAVEKLWTRFSAEFAALGHDVTLISRGYPGLPSCGAEGNVRIARTSGFARSGRQLHDVIADGIYVMAVLGLLRKSDIIVSNTYALPIITTLFPSRFGKTVVDLQRYPKGQLKFYKRCARIRVPSTAILRAVIEQCPSLAARVKVIPNAVDLAVFTPPPTSRPAASAGTILYTGRIHPEKGIHVLVRAFRLIHAQFPKMALRIIGPHETGLGAGGAAYMEALVSLSAGLPVTFAGSMNNPHDLASELWAASIFCYPSLAERGETFGVAALEAMATGLPAVVSKLEVFNDFVEDGKTGVIFDHRSPAPDESLASALRNLILDTELQQKLASCGPERAKRFCYRRVAQELLNDFDELTRTN